MALFNLFNLYNAAFGYVASPYTKQQAEQLNAVAGSYNGIENTKFNEEKQSLIGTPILMACKLDDFELPNEAIVEISGSKSIVKTAIDGQKGTFKELFAVNDLQISIKGIAIQEDGSGNYPKDQLRRLREICDRTEAIPVTNALCTIFGITQIVIENFSIPGVAAAQEWQPYQINALSDFDFDIELKSELPPPGTEAGTTGS